MLKTVRSILFEVRIRIFERLLLAMANASTVSYPLPFCGVKNFFLKILGIRIKNPCFIDSGFRCIYPRNIEIGACCSLGHDNKLWAFSTIKFGPYVQTAMGLTIVSGSHHTDNFEPLLENQEVCLEGENWIGANVTIVGGVTIGRGTVIGAGSVVTRSIPGNCIAAGVPAKVIRERSPADKVLSPFGYYKPTVTQ